MVTWGLNMLSGGLFWEQAGQNGWKLNADMHAVKQTHTLPRSRCQWTAVCLGWLWAAMETSLPLSPPNARAVAFTIKQTDSKIRLHQHEGEHLCRVNSSLRLCILL